MAYSVYAEYLIYYLYSYSKYFIFNLQNLRQVDQVEAHRVFLRHQAFESSKTLVTQYDDYSQIEKWIALNCIALTN